MKSPASSALLAIAMLFEIPLSAAATMANSVLCPADAPANVTLPAKEVCRYAYVRTGEVLPIAEGARSIQLQIDGALQPQQYRRKSDGKTLTITGGSDTAPDINQTVVAAE